MNSKLLLPNKFKRTGWVMLVIVVIALLLRAIFPGSDNPLLNPGIPNWFSRIRQNISMDEVIAVILIVGALFVGFSKEKTEDEGIASLRLNSLLWAVLVNYTFVVIAILLIHDLAFLNVMLYNMYTVLLIFIGRFNFMLYRRTKK